MRGFADRDPLAALINTSLDIGKVSKSNKPFYHGILNPREREAVGMSQEQWEFAADVMERHLKYEGLPRLIVLHEKEGRIHAHIVWSRYDHNTGRLRPDTFNFYKHNAARFQIERALGHERTNDRRDRSKEPTHKERLTQLWQQSGTAAEFIEQAQAAGYEIGQGLDRRPYRVITPEGKSLDLVRQIDGCRKADVQARFKGHELLTEAQALRIVQNRMQSVRQPEQHRYSEDIFEQLKQRDTLMQGFVSNYDRPANDNRSDIFEELKRQQQRPPRDQNLGL
jgi:hypothetical protein